MELINTGYRILDNHCDDGIIVQQGWNMLR